MPMHQVRPVQVWWTETVEIYWFREQDDKTEYRVERRVCPPHIWDEVAEQTGSVPTRGPKETAL